VNKCVQDAHETVLVIAKQLHGYLASNAEDAFNTCNSEAIDKVICQTKRHSFWNFQCFALSTRKHESLQRTEGTHRTNLLKQAVEINVNEISAVRIKQNVLAVSVSKPCVLSAMYQCNITAALPQYEADHTHDSGGSAVC
jgi:hypothetical protein